jgi:hypothetical protein
MSLPSDTRNKPSVVPKESRYRSSLRSHRGNKIGNRWSWNYLTSMASIRYNRRAYLPSLFQMKPEYRSV